MNDLELKNLLLETCPVLPGQEARAWSALKERLNAPRSVEWFSFAALRPLAFAAVAVLLGVAIFDLGLGMRPNRHAIAFADSQAPGIYATAFYSHTAQAQVIWLNGLEPASDQPTYLDPTTKVAPRSAAAHSPKNPNQL